MSRVATQYFLILLVAFGLMASQLLLKFGLKGGALSITSPADLVNLIRQVLTTPALLLGYGLSGFTALMWLVIISRLDLSFAIPLMNAIFYVLLLLASLLVLREDVTIWRWVGTLLVVAGIVLISKPT